MGLPEIVTRVFFPSPIIPVVLSFPPQKDLHTPPYMQMHAYGYTLRCKYVCVYMCTHSLLYMCTYTLPESYTLRILELSPLLHPHFPFWNLS